MNQTVYLVDDDPAYRQSLRFLLEASGLVVRDYSSARGFLEEFSADFSGCLVLDIRMPGMSGMELQETLNKRDILLPVIFITGHGDVPLSVKAMRRGAVDFLEKPFDDADLISRINEAFERDAIHRTREAKRAQLSALFSRLTAREREVLELIVQGYPNKEIATLLQVSPRTVEVHRARIMNKTEVHSIAKLISMFINSKAGSLVH